MSLRVLYVVGGLYTEGSGVARIVTATADAVGRRGATVHLATARCGDERGADHLVGQGVDLIVEPGLGPARLGASPRLRRRLRGLAGEVDIIHNHSLWMLPNHYASEAGARSGVPVLFTIHGFLEPWALSQSGWKKRLVRTWFQDRDLARAACLHVNTREELESVRRYGLSAPAAVIPNGVDLDALDVPDAGASFLASHPALAGRRLAVFMSRLHEKKGLRFLLEAWQEIGGQHPAWDLVVAGPDEGAGAEARAFVRRAGLEDRVHVLGPLYGVEKIGALQAAELFVLPSHSEGFSMAVLEALGSRLPVVITPGCKFPEVEQAGAGRIVEPTTAGVRGALDDLLRAPERMLAEMGARGRALVEASYTWDRVAAELLAVYAWLRGEGDRPGSVFESSHEAPHRG